MAIRLPPWSPERLAQAARELATQGFHTQILSSTGRAEADTQAVAAVRESVGAEVALRLDARAQYAVETARELCLALEPAELQFVLEPLATQEFYLLATLGRETTVPLAVGRTISSPADLLAAVRCGAGKYAAVDISQLGGMMPAKHCAAIAAAARTQLVLGGRPFLGPGTAALLHLAASTAVLTGSHEFAAPPLYDFFLKEPLKFSTGMLNVPPGPGLGVEVDREKVEKYQV